MKTLTSLDNLAAKIENALIIVSVSLITIITFIQIILRSLYSYAHLQWANNALGAIDWSEPLSRLLVLWVTFLGASLLTRDHTHIKIDIMPSFLPSTLLEFRELIISSAAVTILIYMVVASIGFIMVEIEFGTTLFLSVPSWVGQLIIPIGFALILLRYSLRIIELLITLFRRAKA